MQAYKLLIVDDEPEVGELLTYNFRKKGYEVVTANNGIASATSNQSLIQSAIDAGGTKVISKSINLNELIHQVVSIQESKC